MFSDLPIKSGDVIFVSSDITRIAFDCHRRGIDFSADLLIDEIIDMIEDDGTLIFPTFNWDFCRGQTFDYHNTISKVGTLTNVALKRADFKRTRHPIYSFAVHGKHTDLLCSMDNKSSFGSDSPFAFFYEAGAKNLMIDVDYQKSATFVHYVEENIGVEYRFMKDFTAGYIDSEGVFSTRTYSMYVRYLDKEVNVTINPMHEIFVANGAVVETEYNGRVIRLVDMRAAYYLVEQDIVNNSSRRITRYWGN